MTIGFQIYKGATWSDLGLSPMQWASRRATLHYFLEQWAGSDETFDADFIAWLQRFHDVRPPEYPGSKAEDILRFYPEDAPRQAVPRRARPQEELPETLAMAKNFVSAAMAHARTGLKKLDEEHYRQRLAACAQCTSLRADKRCAKCGCFIETKARWASSTCPLSKWATL